MSWLSDIEDWLEEAWELDLDEIDGSGLSDEEILHDLEEIEMDESFESMMQDHSPLDFSDIDV